MTQKLRVWWIPQVPMEQFTVDVPDLKTAKIVLDALADYDLFQLKHNIKPDYSNVGGLSVWDESNQEWVDWEDEETGFELDEYLETQS